MDVTSDGSSRPIDNPEGAIQRVSEEDIAALDEVADKISLDESLGDAQKQEDSKPQFQTGGRKGKKGRKQKFRPLDLSAFPDPGPSAPQKTSNPPASQWRQPNPSSWSRNSGGGATSQSYQAPRSNYGGQGGYGSRPQYQNSQYRERGSNIQLAKAIVALLRHGNPRDIKMDESGYVMVDDIVAHPKFQKFDVTEKAVLKVVDDDTKKRYDLVPADGGGYKIRATQGHTVKLDNEASGLKPLTDPRKHSIIVHGTYSENWRFIKKQGLNRMKRTHIHFAIGYIGETSVTSGMRYSCDITIELDLEKALKDGLKFYESENGVVLCEGDQYGSISPKYFKVVKKYDERSRQFKDINFKYEEA